MENKTYRITYRDQETGSKYNVIEHAHDKGAALEQFKQGFDQCEGLEITEIHNNEEITLRGEDIKVFKGLKYKKNTREDPLIVIVGGFLIFISMSLSVLISNQDNAPFNGVVTLGLFVVGFILCYEFLYNKIKKKRGI